MDLGLEGKTALVTGASQGIGLAIARALFGAGVSIVMVARSADRLNRAANELRAALRNNTPTAVHPVTGDLGAREEVERIAQTALARLGHIDILVNNAASNQTGPFFQLSDADLASAWQVKALGYMRLIRAIAPDMIKRRAGNIINIVGGAARTPDLDFIPGGMVNAALVNFTRGISHELARSGIRINAISPGLVKTERMQASLEREARQRKMSVEAVEHERAHSVPLGRMVTMEEIAMMVILLVSGQVPSLTGEDIILDGGATPSI